jgi:hypothetical protein
MPVKFRIEFKDSRAAFYGQPVAERDSWHIHIPRFGDHVRFRSALGGFYVWCVVDVVWCVDVGRVEVFIEPGLMDDRGRAMEEVVNEN